MRSIVNANLFLVVTALTLCPLCCIAQLQSIIDAVTGFGQDNKRNDEGRVKDTSGQTILRQKEYDFIVIGAGTAGSVIANRLSENPKWNVLLLEAGNDENFLTDIPVLAIMLQSTGYNWGFSTEPHDGACLAMVDKRCRWPRGKALGGSSVINYMFYTRGHKEDYNEWARMGNTGWSYDELLPYFMKSENMQIPELMKSKYHSTGGYLNVVNPPTHTKLADAFLTAGVELGYKIIDINGENQLGFDYLQVTERHGKRCSASKAFLRPIRNRPNLHISMNTRVRKILIDPITKQTTGVEFIKGRLLYTVNVRKEVILSAGALHSPQLLMLSGIGPKDHLEELGIPVLQELKVGHNLQDHVGYLGTTFTVNEPLGIVEKRLLSEMGTHIKQYFLNNTGLLTIPSGFEAVGYIRTKYAKDERPDIEFIFGPLGVNLGGAGILFFGLTDEFYNTLFRPIKDKSVFSIFPFIMHPQSRGILKLKNTSIWSRPKFYANYFTDPQDIKVLLEGVKVAIQLSQTSVFQKYGAKLNDVHTPGCYGFLFGTDEYWECSIRYMTTPFHHQSGTCKMGPQNDQDAVVDPQLKVYGIKGLRVADASIIPQLPSAHTNAPAYMIGEKASDLIKESW